MDFYLLTAGLFLFLSFEKQEEAKRLITPGQYFGHRFSRLFPWAFTAFLLAAVVQRLIIDRVTSPIALLDYFSGDIWEILLVKWTGMSEGGLMLNAPVWTMSSMLLVGFLIWSCIYHGKQKFLDILMPLTLILGVGVWRHVPSDNTQDWIGFTAFGTFRAWLVMCLGYYCLRLGKRLSAAPVNRRGQWLLFGVECVMHLLLLWICLYRNTKYYQWLAILLFMLSIAIAFSGKSYLEQLLRRVRFVPFLGELSLSIYLVHYPMIQLQEWILKHFGIARYYDYRLLFAAVVVVAALLHYYLTPPGIRLCKTAWGKLRGAVVDQNP